jgi:hypothetical protein
VVQCHPDLQDALVEPPYRPRFGTPEILERFVLREIFPAVELRDALEQPSWGWLIATAPGRSVGHRCRESGCRHRSAVVQIHNRIDDEIGPNRPSRSLERNLPVRTRTPTRPASIAAPTSETMSSPTIARWPAGSPKSLIGAAKKAGSGLPKTSAVLPVACSRAARNGPTSSCRPYAPFRCFGFLDVAVAHPRYRRLVLRSVAHYLVVDCRTGHLRLQGAAMGCRPSLTGTPSGACLPACC